MEPSTPHDSQAETIRDVVAIDGPSGAGKSTVARRLAARLDFAYLDTGAMYRAVTWYLLANRVSDLEDEAKVEQLLDQLVLEMPRDGRVLVDGQDVSSHLRSQEVESRVSAVSALAIVRSRMRRLQRQVASRGPIVAEGRDMGSAVFPRAKWKVFLDARSSERASRRRLDFLAAGREVTENQVQEEIEVRDRLDSARKDGPLMRTPDAFYLDTTGHTIDQVVDTLYAQIRPAAEGADSR